MSSKFLLSSLGMLVVNIASCDSKSSGSSRAKTDSAPSSASGQNTSSDPKLTAIVGEYESRCLNQSSSSISAISKLSVTDENSIWTIDYYTGADCSTKSYSAVFTRTYTLGPQTATGVYEIDLKYIESKITPFDEAAATSMNSSSSGFGYTDWAAGVSKLIYGPTPSGKIFPEKDQTLFVVNGLTFDNLGTYITPEKFPTNLMLNNEGLSAETRSSSLDSILKMTKK